MGTAVIKTCGRYIAALFAASIAIFALLRLIPGDPAQIALGVTATPKLVAEKREQLGLNEPVIVQYSHWIWGLLRGDFGISLTSGRDVSALILDRGSVSAIVVATSMIVALLAAIPLGTWAGMRYRQADGLVITGLSQVGIAIPSFVFGIVLVMFLAVKYGLLPANGWVPPGQNFAGFVRHLVMPVVALAAVQGAILTRYVRTSVIETLNEDFIRTARAKGYSMWQALVRHGLRHAAIPVMTVAGIQLAGLVAGAVVIEHVFVLPGLGSMLLDSVSNRDLIVVQTIVMMLVVLTLTVNFLIELASIATDPRITR